MNRNPFIFIVYNYSPENILYMYKYANKTFYLSNFELKAQNQNTGNNRNITKLKKIIQIGISGNYIKKRKQKFMFVRVFNIEISSQ